MQGHQGWMGHSEEVLQNMVHWRRKWQNISVFLPGEPCGQYEKAKIYDRGSSAPQVGRFPIFSGEEWREITNTSRKKEVIGPKQK